MRSIYDYAPAPAAHYMMNDYLATDVILDNTGDHPGAVKDAGGTPTSLFHSVPGKKSLAQDFDGNDDFVEIADHADFTPILTPFSISAWVYMHDATSFVIVSKGVTDINGEWEFLTGAADKIYLNFFDNSVGSSCRIGRYYNTTLTENTWLHLVGTYDGGTLSSGVKIYLNGVRVDDNDDKAGTFVKVENLAGDVYIGRNGAIYSDGLIDNVMLLAAELTARQAMKLADFRGKETLYSRPNNIYNANINNKNSIFGGVKE